MIARASWTVTWEKVRGKVSKGRHHPFEAQKVKIILSKIPLHHNTSAISLKYPSFIFQFDPTRINQALTTRHIFELDYFPAFRLSPILWTCRKATKYIKERHLLSWWRSLFIFFHLSGHGCLLLTLGGLEVALPVERLGWLSIESSAESMYHVSSSNTPPSTVNHGKRIGLGWATL